VVGGFTSRSAEADDTNYQNYVVGQRAMGMGGAFTALSDDGAGAYYNPAGMAMAASTSISASLSVYGVERRQLKEAVSPPVIVDAERPDLTSSNVPTIPTTVGMAYKFGKRMGDDIKRFGIGFSVFVPYHSNFDFSGKTLIGTTDPDEYEVEVLEKDKTVQQGPSFALRITPKLSAGVAIFHVYRSTRWSSTVRQFGPRDANLMTEYFDEQRALITRSIHSMLFKVGARYDISPSWKLGLAVTAPSITLWGNGSTHTSNVTYLESCLDPPRCMRYESFGGTVDADSKTPLSLRAGVAYEYRDRLTLAADLSWHPPLTYDPFDIGEEANKFGETGPVVLTELRRNHVVNVNSGAELLWGKVTLRAGFFTNFSSAPKVQRAGFAMPPRVNMFGATLSAGYRWRTRTISLGVLYCFGSGQSSALREDPLASLDQPYGPVDERRDYVYFFITGAQEALKDTMVKVYKKVRDRIRGKPKAPASSQPASAPSGAQSQPTSR
jgi:long-chain fatty acid transport protein